MNILFQEKENAVASRIRKYYDCSKIYKPLTKEYRYIEYDQSDKQCLPRKPMLFSFFFCSPFSDTHCLNYLIAENLRLDNAKYSVKKD